MKSVRSRKKGNAGRRKENRRKGAAAGAAARLAPLLTVEGLTDTVELALSWEGEPAVLASLTDNGDGVNFSREQGVGTAGLVLRWRSPDAFIHVLQWDLWFEGTRTDLKATAKVNGSGGFAESVESDSEEDRWSASGTAEE